LGFNECPSASLALSLAIVPPKAMVWEDDQGKVWPSYNSSDYLYETGGDRSSSFPD
jgi:hypothetical protein